MTPHFDPPLPERSLTISLARRAWLDGSADTPAASPRIEPWLVRSWQRCLAAGFRPQQRVSFDPVPAARVGQLADRHRDLIRAARPVIDGLSRAIADTRYFAILTDADGIVIDVGALPRGSDGAARQARAIARIGVDLSERAVGTTAIGAALAERESVWLHRGEHFFDDTGVFSCAGAPLSGPQGQCIGMLDLTGVQVVERPELRHLAAASARRIENALVGSHPCELLLQIHWPGGLAGADGGLLCIDADGRLAGANAAARSMLNQPAGSAPAPHCSDLFALPPQMLFDAARRGERWLEVPLWSGLRVQARAWRPGEYRAGAAVADAGLAGACAAGPPSAAAAQAVPQNGAAAGGPRLRELETALIRKTVAEARGNVAQAARTLGISRATVYRKLGRGSR